MILLVDVQAEYGLSGSGATWSARYRHNFSGLTEEALDDWWSWRWDDYAAAEILPGCHKGKP
jgi:hypothetical protein